jgi:cobalt transporter subunit CbtB
MTQSMNQSSTIPQAAPQTGTSIALQRVIAAALGAFIIGMVGFSHMSIAHNASHDYRHSMAFPCH